MREGCRAGNHDTTQRAYCEDVMAFVKFMGIEWPDQAPELLRVSIQDVQAFREKRPPTWRGR